MKPDAVPDSNSLLGAHFKGLTLLCSAETSTMDAAPATRKTDSTKRDIITVFRRDRLTSCCVRILYTVPDTE